MFYLQSTYKHLKVSLMQKLFLSLSILFSVLVFVSCNDEEQADTNTPETTLDTNTIKRALDMRDAAICDQISEFEFCRNGLSFIKIGDTIAWRDITLMNAEVKDSVFEEVQPDTTYAWNVKVIRYPDAPGQIFLEADIFDQYIMNRIRIETPKVKTPHGIGVGSTVAEFMEVYGDDVVVSQLAAYEVVEISLTDNPFLFFHIPNPGNKLLNPEYTEDASIPMDAKIIRVVIWNSGSLGLSS